MKLEKENNKMKPDYPEIKDHYAGSRLLKSAFIIAGCSLAAVSCSTKKSKTDGSGNSKVPNVETKGGKSNMTPPVNMKTPPFPSNHHVIHRTGGVPKKVDIPLVKQPDCDHATKKDHKNCPNFKSHHPGAHKVNNDKTPPKDSMTSSKLPTPKNPAVHVKGKVKIVKPAVKPAVKPSK